MANNKLLAEIARKGGGRLLNAAIDKVLPVAAVAETGDASPRKRSLLGGIAGAMAVRIASRSVPGAIVIGGSLLAKRLYDRRHARDEGKAASGRGGSDKTPAKKDAPKG